MEDSMEASGSVASLSLIFRTLFLDCRNSDRLKNGGNGGSFWLGEQIAVA